MTTTASKRKSSTRATGLNYQRGIDPNLTRNETKGTRPTAAPTSIKEVLIQVVLHVCKKSIFFDTNLKVALYLGALFLVSLIGDFVPFPRTYFSRSDNIFNVYFVKLGWAWTLAVTTPFLCLTSYILCCGDRNRFLTNHLPRIFVATASWFCWTNLFNIIEAAYGRCHNKGFDSKSACLKAGHFWSGFDISGHAFILIYSSLVMIEEARPIVNWESIREFLRNEEHNRATNSESNRTPLRNLNELELKTLKTLYEKYTPIVRLLFVGMTALQLLWDIMLVGTMLYYHRMIEKVVSGVIAILMWFFTYRFWYPSVSIPPDAPGKCLFNYQSVKVDPVPLKRKSSLTYASPSGKPLPKFMGMPLYAAAGANQNNSGGGGDSVPSTSSVGAR